MNQRARPRKEREMAGEPRGPMPADRKPTMSRKEKVIDALVDLSVGLSAGGAASTKAGETAVVLERIVSGLPGTSAGAGEMLALALQALRTAAANRVSDPSKVMEAAADVVTAAARHLDGEDAGFPIDSPEHPVNVLRAILEADHAEAVTQPEAETFRPGIPADEHGPGAAAPDRASRQAATEPARLPADTDMEILEVFVVECLEHISGIEAALLDLGDVPGDAEKINTVFRAFHTIKGSANMLGLDWIQELARLAEDTLVRARKGEIRITGACTDLLLRSCDALKGMVESLEGASPGAELGAPPDLDELLERFAEPETEAASGTPQAGQTGSADVVADDAAEEPSVQRGPAIAAAAEPIIRVRAAKLDSLVDLVGELVIAQSMVGQDPAVVEGANERLTRNVAHAGKLIGELQDLTMSLRMVTLKGTFHTMARLVYDLSQKSGKSVRFVAEGEDTEIDRNMVEALNDPLIHMMRNAVAHGIEPAEQRTRAGKPPAGTVSVRACHAGGHVVIEVGDDGKGLDPQKIAARAAELGLIGPEANLSDNEAFSLLLEPGFTTAEKATDVSGRGVGLDVVKKAVQALRGRVEVASRVGQGCVFTLRLPLTLAITDAMLLRVGTARFLLPTVSIEQSFRPEASAVTAIMGRGEVATFRGDLLPVFRLSELFGIKDALAKPSEALLTVIEGNGRRCAIMADELLGQQQAVIKSLGPSLGQVPGVGGAAILADGRVAMILDAAGILRLACGDPRKGKDAAAAA